MQLVVPNPKQIHDALIFCERDIQCGRPPIERLQLCMMTVHSRAKEVLLDWDSVKIVQFAEVVNDIESNLEVASDMVIKHDDTVKACEVLAVTVEQVRFAWTMVSE